MTLLLRTLILFLSITLIGCSPTCNRLEPIICFNPPPCLIEQFDDAFEELNPEESCQDWGKEMLIAFVFAREMDLYRALTGFKRALILIPCSLKERRLQIEYSIVLCYYLGNKYREAAEAFENSRLCDVQKDFPAFNELLMILYDSYLKIGQSAKALRILCLIESDDPEQTLRLQLYQTINAADLCGASSLARDTCYQDKYCSFLFNYETGTKSIGKARALNAILPGAGYLYVGQQKSALTSFLINALFIAAAYRFFETGNIAAGLITTSIESGWYLGGINGAGLAAKEFNDRRYETCAKEFMLKNRLFPVLMFQKAF